jgi:hypothetical protein
MGGKTNAHTLQHGGGGRLLALQKEAIWGAVWAQVPACAPWISLACSSFSKSLYIRFFHILFLVNSSFFY